MAFSVHRGICRAWERERRAVGAGTCVLLGSEAVRDKQISAYHGKGLAVAI